jgi:DeoR family fructose operon transcriptional repressor
MTVRGTLDAETRREALVEVLLREGNLQLQEAARRWNVHEMTIRRDFDVIVSGGLARRVRGGIIALQGEDFDQRKHMNAPAKQVIAKKLRSLVGAGQVIAMDASTTISTFAEALTDCDGLMVVTNGLSAFHSLHGRPGVRAYLTGGEQEDQNQSLVGSLAQQAIQQFAIDVAFISTMSVDPDFGTSEMTLEQVAFKRALVENSSRVVVAVDSTKLGGRARFRSLPLPRHHVLVTELDPQDAHLDPYRGLVGEIL